MEWVSSLFHGAMVSFHLFAVVLFGDRVLKAKRRRESTGWVLSWFTFHLLVAVVSLISSLVHWKGAHRDRHTA